MSSVTSPQPLRAARRERPAEGWSEDADNILDYVIVVGETAVNYASHLSLAIFNVNKLVFTLLFT